ncbi:hypothetical protein H6F50_09370 [Coleofasciculus sp. FACHB-712]|uniref:hypothetical protein n=1 Tax=Cyanophyceae TaxID=3028117 RepID=UPI001687A789|nr:hypothetical protein [Coleofasciculus sp. FACHB-712]MBD1942562.1 hypothetical protein [Coleofasciculus sp. FACHB-712]
MSQTDNEDIPFKQLLGLVDAAVFNATGKHLETHQQQEDLLGFLYDLPATVKVVITSREPTPFTSTIRLAALPEPEAIYLIQHQAREKDIQLSLEQSQQPSAISRLDLMQVGSGALFTWAWQEFFDGVNYFRRALGLVVLGAMIALRLHIG